jgi:hypothetical protein
MIFGRYQESTVAQFPDPNKEIGGVEIGGKEKMRPPSYGVIAQAIELLREPVWLSTSVSV